MLINQANVSALFSGFNMAFNAGFTGAPSYYSSVAMVVPSTSRDETYSWLGQFPKMREWVGPRVVQNLALHSYAVSNVPFEQTISVDRDDIEDDKYGVFSPMFAEMGRAAAEKPDQLVFTLLAGGFSNACYDGQYFFDTDHPVKAPSGETISVGNMQAGSGPAWYLMDTSRAVKPLIFQERRPLGALVHKDRPEDDNVFNNKEYIYGSDGRCNAGYGLWQLAYASKAPLTAENYEAARLAMRTLVGDEGRPLGVNPDTLVAPVALEGDAMRLLNNGTRLVTEIDGAPLDAPVAMQNEWAKTAKPIITAWVS